MRKVIDKFKNRLFSIKNLEPGSESELETEFKHKKSSLKSSLKSLLKSSLKSPEEFLNEIVNEEKHINEKIFRNYQNPKPIISKPTIFS